MAYLNLIELANFAVACGNGEAQSHLRHRVKVLTAQAQLDGTEVVRMLRDTGSVLGGFGVLTVLLPYTFRAEGLDIFCGCHGLDDVTTFLRGKGYGPAEVLETPNLVDSHRHHMAHTVNTHFAVRGTVKGLSSMIPDQGREWFAVQALIAKYKSLGFDLYESCTQLKNHSTRACSKGRARQYTLPDGATYVSDVLSLYCKRSIRKPYDWCTAIMSFTKNQYVEEDRHCLAWKLCHVYTKEEATLLGQRATAWVEVKRIEHKSWLYTSVSDVLIEGVDLDISGEVEGDDIFGDEDSALGSVEGGEAVEL
ncbi:hypothetical protein BKA70DRAFT_1450900 [Coprinopsis sp. MPI-PUGE-AT-0042]|nr:hypothetical protein BKA70DRAFT_1450900 [Coprinopsis sp. MPI-PUGE-AT-0042]